MNSDLLLLFGSLLGGAMAGWISRFGPKSSGAALALTLLPPPLGLWLAMTFC